MHFLLEPLFALFGKRAGGQLVGATVIGAILPAMIFLREGETPPGGFLPWVIGGAIAGFTAGLVLLSPRRFFGSLFVWLGLATLAAPVSHADGSPVGFQTYLIKCSLGVGLLALGLFLLFRAWSLLKTTATEQLEISDTRPTAGRAD